MVWFYCSFYHMGGFFLFFVGLQDIYQPDAGVYIRSSWRIVGNINPVPLAITGPATTPSILIAIFPIPSGGPLSHISGFSPGRVPATDFSGN